MTQGFFQFNNSIINEILNFATSSFDLLYMSGPKGSSKSETIQKAIPLLEDNNLIFQHFCFENTVIDDFLLNFYDALRSFSLAQKISLKKFTTDDFQEKVSHYFKTINSNCIIIIENFEKTDENVEIVDFLSHLASYINVKIIILSRNQNKNLFRFKPVKMVTLELNPINKEEFKSKMTLLDDTNDDNLKERFYEITKGLELYLKMSVKYCSVAGISISDLVNEFERKSLTSKTDFEEFIVSKFVSLTPGIYQSLFKTLCNFNHPVSIDFLETYQLGNQNRAEYLYKNFLISYFRKEIYVKEYFKHYIFSTFSIQEKINYCKQFIDIYENELTKSPKDRLLRLSRESIRKEIDRFNSLMPKISVNDKSEKAFSYLGMLNSNWHDEKMRQKNKLSEKLNKIKERKNQLSLNSNQSFKEKPALGLSKINQQKEKDRQFIITLINSSRNFIKEYRYNDAISELHKALEADFDDEFKIEILSLIAQNYEYLKNFNKAQKYYSKALEIALETRDTRKSELEFSIAVTDKKLFKTELAKTRFQKIANNENSPLSLRAKAFLELGEINEANSEINEAIVDYKNALSFVQGKNKELTCTCYYKLGLLYDENQNNEEAIKYYRKNYMTSSEKQYNKYYSISLANLGLIYIEQSKYQEASEALRLALMFDNENNDLENVYFSQKELAKLYLKFDINSAITYYRQALYTAQQLKDVFKEALVYFEMGEFYYDKQEDKKSLLNFIKAKKVLENTSDEENLQRINTRIKDIKMRMDEDDFRIISEKYDN